MKVYWAAGRGTVITSANLSTNALGEGKLKEIGVLLPPNALDIDEIIASTKSRPCRDVEMRHLEFRHREINAKREHQTSPKDKSDYLEWYELIHPSEWKLGWWDAEGGFSVRAKDLARAYYNKPEPHEYIEGRAKDFRENDWILTFRLGDNNASELQWLFVDHIVKVDPKDKVFDAKYPYHAIQVHTAKYYSAPPFDLTKEFRAAFQEVSKAWGIERIKKTRSVIPPAKFLEKLKDAYSGIVSNRLG
jgi:hypothetical protein